MENRLKPVRRRSPNVPRHVSPTRRRIAFGGLHSAVFIRRAAHQRRHRHPNASVANRRLTWKPGSSLFDAAPPTCLGTFPIPDAELHSAVFIRRASFGGHHSAVTIRRAAHQRRHRHPNASVANRRLTWKTGSSLFDAAPPTCLGTFLLPDAELHSAVTIRRSPFGGLHSAVTIPPAIQSALTPTAPQTPPTPPGNPPRDPPA